MNSLHLKIYFLEPPRPLMARRHYNYWVSRNSRSIAQIWGYAGCSAPRIPPNLGATTAIPRESKYSLRLKSSLGFHRGNLF